MTTHSAFEELLTQHYPLSNVQFIQRLPTNGSRQAHVLETDQGRFVLKLTDQARPETTVQTDLATLVRLEQADFPAPRLFPARDGQRYVPFGAAFVYLYRYIDGVQPGPSDSFFPRLGELLARLHTIPLTADLPRSDWRPSVEAPNLIEIFQQVEAPDRPMAEAALAALVDFPDMHELPTGLIHSDPWFGNLLEDAAGRLHMVDWDDAGVSYPLLDVAYVLTYPCTQLPKEQTGGGQEPIWRGEWADAFLKAYQAIRPLNADEVRLLPAAVRLNGLAYLPNWGTRRLIADNFQRWQLLEGVFHIG